jgi:acyl-CoA thioester hydrolase
MPLTHIRTFRVRSYECDAYGHVNHANYLRYMQEAAFEASAAAGYDVGRYQAMDRTWLIRETEIEYLRPLRYGDTVQVRTWVADFRRVRSRRAYEFRLVGTGKLVARAQTDWFFLDSTTWRPAPIPHEMKAAFWPEGVPDVTPPRRRFPPAPPPPPRAFRQRRRVEWRDLDEIGHVNNAIYLAYVEDCGIQMLAARGWPLARMTAEGFAVVARQHHIEYQMPGLMDDELEVLTWLSDVDAGGATAVRHTTVARVSEGALLLRTRTVHVWVDLRTGKPTPIPIAFLNDMGPCIAGGSPA